MLLRPLLVDEVLENGWIRDQGWSPRLAGKRVQAIDSVGKHLLIAIEGAWIIRVHLGMRGRWRIYERAPTASLGLHDAAVVLRTATSTAICVRAMQAELIRAGDPGLRRRLEALGPDLLAPDVDWSRILERARTQEPQAIAEVLLDQRVAAGVGNVYKSEVLFLEGVHPRTPVANLADDPLLAVFRRARELMQANLGPGLRTTTTLSAPGRRRPISTSRAWVYRRHGLPCLRCRTRIERAIQGDMARSTYWCPRCQPATPRAPTGSF